jgi:hypothetical protein
MNLNNISFVFPLETNLKGLIDEISAYYLLKADQDDIKTASYFDTFDWRLYNNDLVLYQTNGNIILEKLSDGLEITSFQSADLADFIFELPDKRFHQEIASMIEPRALIKIAKLQNRWKRYLVLNEDQKTVSRLIFEETSTSGVDFKTITTQLRLIPVRGYPRYFRELVNFLTNLGFVGSSNEEVFIKKLNAIGKHPGDYSAKLNFQLDASMRADFATKVILRFLLDVIRKNEEGIQQDIDTEFLHDFRVAIRRTRSALSQIRDVFPVEITEGFKQDFAYLGNLTNPLRELDVY